ncbi:hypothetical protein DFS34DRAFT_222116 [Phlyctochytrium arcticum]|nr:hypothetical protein DFS34DRAFT_222116 [Phlyctochytrium arcticum]
MNSAEPAAAANDQVGATQGPTGPTSTTAAAANTIISSSSSGSNTSGSNQSNSNSEADGKKRRNSNSTTTGENAAATTTTPADQDSPAKKRKQVKNACVNCQKACKKCEMARPCPRCVRYGLQDSCHDSVRKERKKGVSRGPYKRKSETQDGETPSPTPTPSPERMEGTSNTHNTRSSRAITEKAMGRHHHRIRSTTLLVLKREDIDTPNKSLGTNLPSSRTSAPPSFNITSPMTPPRLSTQHPPPLALRRTIP